MFYLHYLPEREISCFVYFTIQNKYTLPNGSPVGYGIVNVQNKISVSPSLCYACSMHDEKCVVVPDDVVVCTGMQNVIMTKVCNIYLTDLDNNIVRLFV
jgi:hypothetical protein